MSSVTHRPGSLDPPHTPVEVFPYGWRYVATKRPDGTTDLVWVPLTLEDVLHPQYGDVMPESTLHERMRTYLSAVCRECTYGDPTALVISDLLVYWDDPTLKQHGPDVGVIFGVRNRDAPRKSFRVAEERARPRVIIEIVSPDTRRNDVDDKLAEYHQAHVRYYIILDRSKEDDPWQLRGYRYATGQYEEMAKDERGRLWLEDLGIWLATDGQDVICYDGATGEIIGDYRQTRRDLKQIRQTLEVEKLRADAAETRANAAETSLRELEAEIARLRSQPPSP